MKRHLVNDDAEFILESTTALLEFEGYDVSTAENGSIGVQMAKEFKPDLILCDISMPVMDGFEVLDNIRSDNITLRIPFIFLTAFAFLNMVIGIVVNVLEEEHQREVENDPNQVSLSDLKVEIESLKRLIEEQHRQNSKR